MAASEAEAKVGNWLGDWLFDDWERAVRRSLARDFTPVQRRVLRAQRRLGQGVKASVLLLPVLVCFSFLVPGSRWLLLMLLAWAGGVSGALAGHVVLGVRHGVSYGWALHHTRSMLLRRLAARRDLRLKAALAAALTVLLVRGLVTLFGGG